MLSPKVGGKSKLILLFVIFTLFSCKKYEYDKATLVKLDSNLTVVKVVEDNETLNKINLELNNMEKQEGILVSPSSDYMLLCNKKGIVDSFYIYENGIKFKKEIYKSRRKIVEEVLGNVPN
jgi:hypothetical protein